jgi:hypothetical protein
VGYKNLLRGALEAIENAGHLRRPPVSRNRAKQSKPPATEPKAQAGSGVDSGTAGAKPDDFRLLKPQHYAQRMPVCTPVHSASKGSSFKLLILQKTNYGAAIALK